MTTGRWKAGLRALGSSWGALTLDERKALCLILALACLGLAAKAWHVRHAAQKPAGPEAHALPTPRR